MALPEIQIPTLIILADPKILTAMGMLRVLETLFACSSGFSHSPRSQLVQGIPAIQSRGGSKGQAASSDSGPSSLPLTAVCHHCGNCNACVHQKY